MTDKILEMAKEAGFEIVDGMIDLGEHSDYTATESLKAFANLIRAECQWISVDDRLPDGDKTVICADIPYEFIKLFNIGNYSPATDEIFGACFVQGKWTYEPYGDYESTARVTHWMQPPKAMSEKG